MTDTKKELPKTYRCKFCKVQVVSPSNKQPILGQTHGKHCPRRFK